MQRAQDMRQGGHPEVGVPGRVQGPLKQVHEGFRGDTRVSPYAVTSKIDTHTSQSIASESIKQTITAKGDLTHLES